MSNQIKKEKQNKIFRHLNAINKGKTNYLSSLSKDEQSTVIPFMLLKWIAGSESESQIAIADQYVNQCVFTLYDHPELLWKMLSSTTLTSGKNIRYKWLSPKKNISKKNTIDFLCEAFNCSVAEAESLLLVKDKAFILNQAIEYGLSDNEIKEITKELK